MLGMLVVQLLLGMALNLYVVLPSQGLVRILESSPVLLLHIVLALLLVGLSARAVALASRAHEARATLGSLLALGSALLATAAGISFTFGSGSPGASFAMSVGFAGMLVGAGLLLSMRSAPLGAPPWSVAGSEPASTTDG